MGALIVLLAPGEEIPVVVALPSEPETEVAPQPAADAIVVVATPTARPAAAAAPAATPTARIVVVTATPESTTPAPPTATPPPLPPAAEVEETEIVGEQPEPEVIAEPTPSDSAIDALISELGSADSTAEQRAAKILYRRHRLDPKVQQAASDALLAGCTTRLNDPRHVDAMAWLCNILGVSGNIAYATTLDTVLKTTTSRKIKGFAQKNRGRIR